MIDRAYNWMILAIRLAARACIPALRAWVMVGQTIDSNQNNNIQRYNTFKK
jgi:hypothetical protein